MELTKKNKPTMVQFINLYEDEIKKLKELAKPHLKNQEYCKASKYQDRLNCITEFLTNLKLVLE
jgi:Tfp pilus assembly protein PilF